MGVTATILGCGSSGGVPRIGNDWGACDPAEPRNRRLRCSMLVRKTGPEGETTVLIDTGPDLREQMLSANVRTLDAVLYTHAHADHLHGIDDLRIFTIRGGHKTPVYMDAPTYERSFASFGYCFETPQGSSYPPILDRQELVSGRSVTIDGAGGRIDFQPIEVVHGDIGALAFRFEDIAYMPDVSDISASSAAYLRDLDVLIVDCLRRRPHPSHFNLDDALAWIAELTPRRAILTNLHNDLDYRELSAELPDTIVPAFDGMEIASLR